ncbi:MAG TPA: hypothetical protein VFR58_07195 [Flavisolibacter sp.]|nr:hypothetical protein [Flavisolibacter sp.]
MQKRLAPIFFLLTVIMACNNRDASPGEEAQTAVFLDYKVSAEDGKENAVCLFQIRRGGPEGVAFSLLPPAGVWLDDQAIKPDSTKFMGSYYEASVPLAEFAGQHTIRAVLPDGRPHNEVFDFQPFSLAGEWSVTQVRRPFTIRLANLPQRETRLRLVMIDTAFASADVNEFVGVVNGQLDVTQAMLDNLVDGPVMVELYREQEKRLKPGPRLGGAISIIYGLKREFELVAE